MTLKKCKTYSILGISMISMALIFSILKVSKLTVSFGIIGLVVGALLSSLSIGLSLKTIKMESVLDTQKQINTRQKNLNFFDWLSFISVSTMGILLVFMFVMIPSDVKQNSMFPTLISGDRVVVYHFLYHPKRNDIAVADMSNYGDSNLYVKRIFGVPGDRIHFHPINESDFHLYINDQLAESIAGVTYKMDQQGIDKIQSQLDEHSRLKDQFYLLLGDNALGSTDSRKLGAIHERDLIGKIIFIFWRFR